ncbi:hypothetical protein Tco_0191036 [Tanacetum coccineum]
MTDLDVALLVLGLDEDVHSLTSLICNFKVIEVLTEHAIAKLNCYNMSNSQIRATIKEYQEDMGVEASSASPKKNELLMLECLKIGFVVVVDFVVCFGKFVEMQEKLVVEIEEKLVARESSELG